MYPILFKIGPVAIYTYGVMIALGIMAGLYFASRQAKKEAIGSGIIVDIVFWIILSGFIGARITYVFVEWKYFTEYPLKVLFAREGFVFYGGFIFSFLTAFLYVKIKKLNAWKLADIIAPSTALGYAIGRLGCFFYGCCYGRPTNSLLGILFPPEVPAGSLGVKVIPTQLISSLTLFIIFIILVALRKHKKFDGQIFWIFVLLEAITRFGIEFLRGDERGTIGALSISQVIAIFMAVVAAVILARAKKYGKKI